MQKGPRLHVELVKRHFHTLMEKGVPQDILEKALRFSKEELTDDELRIPFKNNMKMLRKGLEYLGPDMGIKIAAAASPEIVGILGQIMKNCINLGEATDQFVRFQNLYFVLSKFRTTVEDGRGIIVHSLNYPLSAEDKRLVTELNLAICVAVARKLAGEDFAPQEIHFSYEMPEYVDTYRAHFRCPLKFKQKRDAIVIDRKLAQKTIPGSQVYMKNILTDYSEKCLAKLQVGKPFQDEVKKTIAALLPKGVAGIEQIAEQLHVSRWTLTRNLKKEGTTFKSALKALKKELAINYLGNKKLSTLEIAFLLGYSEASAFQRAFKCWTGKNPHEYRKTI